MKVSLVIPTYNEEDYIGKCLESIKAQEVQPDEVIVVDNNSSDKTVQIAKEYLVKVLHEKKQGITHARNRGFNEAQYEIIARCDADSILPLNWIKKIKSDFAKQKIDALSSAFIFYDTPVKKNSSIIKTYMAFMEKILKHPLLLGHGYALTKNIWEKVKGLTCKDDSKVHEDIDLAIHINEIGGKIMYDPTLVVKASGRRMKYNPFSFFVEYPSRLVKMLQQHNKF